MTNLGVLTSQCLATKAEERWRDVENKTAAHAYLAEANFALEKSVSSVPIYTRDQGHRVYPR